MNKKGDTIIFPKNALAARVSDFGGVTKYHFDPERRWYFWGAFPDMLVAVEFDNQNIGTSSNHEKYNAAALKGWSILTYTGKMVRAGLPQEHFKALGLVDKTRV
jgi:hypothetical protein